MFGALGTVLSAWLVNRVSRVARAVNGQRADLELEVELLRDELARLQDAVLVELGRGGGRDPAAAP